MKAATRTETRRRLQPWLNRGSRRYWNLILSMKYPFYAFIYWHRIRMCLLTHEDVTLSRPDRNNITISIYFHVMSQALSRRFVWGTCSYERTTYSLNDPFAPCKLHGFPRLTATFFWQLRRRGREQGGLTLVLRMAVNPWARFVFFLSDSCAILSRPKS